MTIHDILNTTYALPEGSLNSMTTSIAEKSFPKGHVLFDSTKVEPSIYFIKQGIARAFFFMKDTEVTFWFGKEGDAVISMKSYVANEKSYEKIELLEHSELYEMKISRLKELFNEDIHIANWGRRFAEKELLKTEERFISREFKTARERYKDLVDKNPDLLQRVSLGHIAGYLGITQVSLSRVRAEFK